MKSYKICPCSSFDKSKFKQDKLSLNTNQHNLVGLDVIPEPITEIFRSVLGTVYEDFDAYRIEHEHNVNVNGRYFNTYFDHFLRKGEIMGYHSESKNLLLLSGKKDDIIDFTKYTSNTDSLNISTIEVDMAQLLEKLTSVNLVWFKFKGSMIRASALMGEHIERTDEFNQAKEVGEISTLSFYLEDANRNTHPIMVTHDGAVVLQTNYPDLSKEIELVLEVKKELLDGIYTEKPIGKKNKNLVNNH